MAVIFSSENRAHANTPLRPADPGIGLDREARLAAQESPRENLPDAQDERLIACLRQEGKPLRRASSRMWRTPRWVRAGAPFRLQSALFAPLFLVAALCCAYAAFYVRQSGRELSQLDFLDVAERAILMRHQNVAPDLADEDDQNMAPGEVRASVVRDNARAPVDADAMDLNDPDGWGKLAEATLANKSRAVFQTAPADAMAGNVPTEHAVQASVAVNQGNGLPAKNDAPARQSAGEPAPRTNLLIYLPAYLAYAPVPYPPYPSGMRVYQPGMAERDAPDSSQRRHLASRRVLEPETGVGDAPPGILSAHFESGAAGAAAVGLSNRKGGTCYGTFQIASGTPTFKGFLYFLEKHAPDIAAKLEKSGPANTGSTSGHLPDEWRRIASEEPKRFARLQYQFVLQTHYRPALNAIEENTGIDIAKLSPATQDVLWSTAVQHGVGGATGIFTQALGDVKALASNSKTSGNAAFEKNLIEKVYQLRNRSFKKSGQGMNSRFDRELMMALLLLNQHYSADSATTPDPVTPDPGTVTNRTTRPSS